MMRTLGSWRIASGQERQEFKVVGFDIDP